MSLDDRTIEIILCILIGGALFGALISLFFKNKRKNKGGKVDEETSETPVGNSDKDATFKDD
jgi:hypothetical protein